MQKASVVVVCPVFNTPTAYLRELVDSLHGAGLEPGDRVIWVDDASTERTGWLWLRSQEGIPACFEFIELSHNRGVAAALNRGIREADEEAFIVTMGSDDVFFPGYLTRAAALLREDPTCQVVVPRVELFGNKTGCLDPSREHFELGYLWQHNTIPAASLFRRSLWQALGGFDEDLSQNFEDWDFWFRARLRGALFKKLEEWGYRYRVRSGLSEGIPFEKARARLRRKWWWSWTLYRGRCQLRAWGRLVFR